MKKMFEIRHPGNKLFVLLILSVTAFNGCASEKNVVTPNASTPGNASNLTSRTPQIKTEPRRPESLENHDSEDPEHYKPAYNTNVKNNNGS